MATNLSDASALAWILAIEALASFSEVDTSLLIDLVKKAPKKISDHVGENAREMVSLRILESLSGQKKGVTGSVSPKSDSDVSFDESESCENVLREILSKSSGSSWIDSVMLKRDFEPFIQHKRSCLLKSALQQLKDAILEDNHLIPTSLKERSGLIITNQSDGNAQRSEGSNSDVQEIPPTRNSLSAKRVRNDSATDNHGGPSTCNAQRSEGSNSDVQEIPPTGNSLSAKRVRNDSATDNHGGPSTCNQVIVDNAYDVRYYAVKEPFCTQQAMNGQNSVSFLGSRLVDDFSGRIVQHTENGSALSKEPQVGALKESNIPENVNYEFVASKRLRMSNDIDGTDFLHDQQQASSNDEKLSQDTSGEGHGQIMGVNETKEDSEDCAELKTLSSAQQAVTQKINSVDEAKEKCEHSFPLNARNDVCCGEAKAAMGHSCESEISREGDGYHDENNDIIAKNSFLSSQCTYSEDSLGTEDGTEQHCTICKKGDQLLVCSSDACPRVVHESCMGVAATFDERGSFYCPFCSYSRAISEFMNSKKKCSLARKYLASFTGLGVEYLQCNSSKKLHREDQNRSREDEDLDECIEPSSAENVVDRVNNTQSRVNTKDLQQAEPSVSSDSPCGGKGRAVTNGGNDVPTEDKSNAQKTSSPVLAVQNCEADDSFCRGSKRLAGIEEQQEVLPQPNDVTHVENPVLSEDKRETQMMGNSLCCQSSREQEEPKIALQAVQDCEVHNSNCSDSKIVHGSEQHGGIEKVQEILNQQNAVLPHEIVEPPSIDRVESSGEKKYRSNASNHTLRVQKQEIQYTYPPIPQLRRKAISWTNVEEETLKEGVQKFASKHDTKIPWKTILEFGSAVFHEGRTAIDLKDKWRNICKGTPKV